MKFKRAQSGDRKIKRHFAFFPVTAQNPKTNKLETRWLEHVKYEVECLNDVGWENQYFYDSCFDEQMTPREEELVNEFVQKLEDVGYRVITSEQEIEEEMDEEVDDERWIRVLKNSTNTIVIYRDINYNDLFVSYHGCLTDRHGYSEAGTIPLDKHASNIITRKFTH